MFILACVQIWAEILLSRKSGSSVTGPCMEQTTCTFLPQFTRLLGSSEVSRRIKSWVEEVLMDCVSAEGAFSGVELDAHSCM